MERITSDDLRESARSARAHGSTSLALALEIAADECDAPFRPSNVSLEPLFDLIETPVDSE